jgi:hypothetical protein
MTIVNVDWMRVLLAIYNWQVPHRDRCRACWCTSLLVAFLSCMLWYNAMLLSHTRCGTPGGGSDAFIWFCGEVGQRFAIVRR